MAEEDKLDPDAGLSPQELEREKKLEEEERKKNPELFQKNTEWLEKVSQVLEGISSEDADRAMKLMERYIEGEVTWAEVQGMPPELLSEITEYGYLQFQRGKLKEAEMVFKGLSFLDHKNAYYHTVLGAIYQKMEKFGDALGEYTAAIEMNPKDITAYANRGEIFHRTYCRDEALADFEKAIELDSSGKDPWANRARFLKNLILQEREEDKKDEKRK